ncbi:MAG: DUF1801 domain-containing protein [Acidobacteria bacterium]|nr:DUF1801 domain-containing protein [Acidobacteriota bacterium]
MKKVAKRPSIDPAVDDGPAQVEAYLSAVPEPAQTTLRKLRAHLRAAVPAEATELMSYGMPAFSWKLGRKQACLAGYAAFKHHCGYFPMSSAVMTVMAEDLQAFPSSKGGFQFPHDQPLPVTLVRKLVKARLVELEQKDGR